MSFVIKSGHLNICCTVPDNVLFEIHALVDSFAHVIVADKSADALFVFAMFLQHCCVHGSAKAAQAVFQSFCDMFDIANQDIHVAVANRKYNDDKHVHQVLKAYFSAYPFCDPLFPDSALLSSSNVVFPMAVFGGNTGSTSYLDQARWMVDVYGPLISDYVVQVSEFLNAESMDDRLIDAYGDGLAIHRWITEPASVPEHEYLISSPVSMPLIGLVQLMQLMVLYKSFNVSPGDLARRFSVATGHSQGIISAVLLSTLTDDEDSFISGSKKALGLWMLIGALPQLAYPYFRLIERGSDGLSKNADVQPTPMVSVQGLTRSQLTNIIDDFNAGQPASVAGDSSRVQPAVANTVDRFVVAGQLEHAAKFARYAKSLSAAPGEDQTKLPLALRKPVISVDFLGMTVPYHCNLLKESVEDIHAILKEKGWTFDAADMRIAVRSSYDGHDIRSESDLTRYLIKSVCILPVDWPCAATAPEITHDVYFGTDGLHGFARLTFSNIEGRGVPVICAGVVSSKSPRLPHIGTNANLYRSKLSDVTAAPNWLAEFGPKLVRVASSDTVHIDSKMHRMYGMPTVMVAGMTPTTVNEDFVAAVSQAGYHVELAGGGIYTADSLDTKVRSLASMLKPGQGITLNCIYFDQKQWSFQFPGILRLRSKEGMPIVGLCIGGGVPSVEKALEIIETLRANGFRHMSFKPSNAQAILTVVEIAQKCDGFPVGLQWTGGRAGGHHSFEDFHQPILQTYGAIRAQKNIALIAGSGFGDGEGSFPYLTGDWSVEFGYAPMPFDGILLGSRVMVAKETATELAAKELIVSVSGLSDAEWTESLDSVQGGVTTITSEYGEKNHVIATRGVRFVQFVHETILSKPRGERRSLLMERKDEIIAGLNASHARPWFGKNANGQVVDLEDMTYAEVIARMVELMYSQKLQRWLYDSYSRIVLDFVNRTELRFADFGTGTGSAIGLMLSEVHPQDFVSQILKAYPDAGTQLIASEDVQYFIALCKRRGQKVVPFAPVLDEDFGMFILKDMLWLSEFLDAVHDGDVQRTVIQQGVVSARYSTRVDEPVRDILDGVYHGHVSALLDKLYDGSKSMVPVVESITSDKVDGSFDMANIVSVQDEIKRIFSVPLSLDKLHAGDQWLQAIAGPRLSWLYFLLTSQILVKGTSYTDNFVGRVMRARPGRVYTVLLDNGLPSKVEVTRGDAAGSQTTELVLEFDKATHQISLYVYHPKRDGIASLHLVLEYHPEQPLAPIHLDTEQYVRGVRQFYAETWRDNSDDPVKFEDILSTDEPITTNGFVITESHLRAHCKNIGNRSQRYACASDDGIRYVPDDFALLSSAPDIICVTASSLFGSGQMNVVQLYNRVRTVDGAPRLAVGDFVNSTMVFDEIVNSPYGRTIKVTFTAFCNRKPMALVEVALLSRNNPASNDMTFQKLRDQRYTVLLKTVADVAVLEAKEWFCYTGAVQSLAPMSEIEFQVDSHYRFKSDTVYSSIQTTGHVYLKPTRGKPVLIGEVNFVWGEAAADPVIEYLKRHSVGSNAVLFEDGGYSIVPLAGESQVTSETQKTNDDCARISGDYNPIHTNPYIADIAGLPDTITHGVWTSLALRAVMESCAADDQPGRAHSYQTDFVGMVIPGDTLKTKLRHIGMSDGRMVVHAETFNQHSEVVLKCSTEIKQPATAYVFTGQGLQEVGMGMALYAQSGAAKSIWDRADDHIRTFYGISILDIVRKNPKAVTVYFGGRQGETILSNYMSLTREDSAAKEAVDSVVPLFPEIDADSECFTFVSPTGLLNATQFTQVALVVLSMAAIADMRAKGLIQRDAAFAGHSLGEYCALATLSDIFTLEDVIDVVFYRGLVMQSVVERNDQGISQYGMVAVNPSRLGSWFSEAELAAVVAGIAEQDSNRGLIEVVNFNVKGEQYVVAGSLSQLTALRMVLDRLAADTNKSADNTEQRIQSAVEAVFAMGPISADEQPQRGQATVPLAGIDVPFHSSLLKRGVSSFRGILKQRICSEFIDVKQLSQKYIPNLTATPFEVSKSYFERVYQISGSSVIGDILENWSDNEEIAEDSDKAAELAAALVIELLAYQFASPVQWISTQDQLFNRFGIARLIEIGAAPVLCGMADKTLHSLHSNDGSVSVLHIDRDAEKVYYTERTQKSEENTSPVSDDSPAPAPAPAPVTQPVAEAAIAQTVPDTAKDSGAPDFAAAADIVDVPLQPISVLHAIIAHKTKQSLSAVSLQSTIKGLVGGKSTLQNEIVGDIHKEFEGKVPDNVEEMPLQEVAGAVGASGANGVSLGKYTQSLVSRLFSTKMPGGFTVSSVRGLLESSYGLGPRRQDAALLVALTMEPSDRLANEQVANAWVDTVAKAYAQSAGISFAKRSGAAASGGRSSAKSLISSAALDGLQKKQREHTMQQIEVLARYAGLDLRQSGRLADKHQAQTSNTQVKLDSVYSEFGEELIDGVKSRFDIRRIRRFDSYWNWARQQAFEWVQSTVVSGKLVENAQLLHYLRNSSHPELVKMLAGMAGVFETAANPALEPALQLAKQIHSVCTDALMQPPVYVEFSTPTRPKTSISSNGNVSYSEVPRDAEPDYTAFVERIRRQSQAAAESEDEPLPLLYICERVIDKQSAGKVWKYSNRLSQTYYDSMYSAATTGLSFAGKTALVTGCGRNSIGLEIVRGLLSGGAKVIATYFTHSLAAIRGFEQLYRDHGARGSELILVPFNQGSASDIKELIDYIYRDVNSKGLGWDLDYVFPFAAVTDIGSFATNLSSQSEFAQRVMLTNTLRLLGAIKLAKEQRRYFGRPTLIIVPLSPNHGDFGGDGLYGETKLGLETTFNRWTSESWKGYLSIAGTAIGGTRGTASMLANNLIAEQIEDLGARMFSTCEMAFCILGILHKQICRAAHNAPMLVDLRGDFQKVVDMHSATVKARQTIDAISATKQIIGKELALDLQATSRIAGSIDSYATDADVLANHMLRMPNPVDVSRLKHLPNLQGMLNLDKIVVITGYGEVGSYGHSETRWEMEAFGELSVEGCIELAWIMGLIKHFNGVHPATDKHYVGWVDAKSNDPVSDTQIKPRYETYILEHTGGRLIEPELANGYDPTNSFVLREIQLEHDMEPFETTLDAAQAYKQHNRHKVDIWENKNSKGSWFVRFFKGALVRVPAAINPSRLVAALLPTGWDARRFGISEEIIDQVDPVTLFALVAMVEALVRSGITDPYELYMYMHVSEVGNTTGATSGGVKSSCDVFRKRFMDSGINADAFQESFVSTVQAWINMLLMSGSGPVKPISGACATVAASIDAAVESIQLGKARFMVAGGFEDFSEVSSIEFANVGATSNTLDEIASGRAPSEMCRPCTSTRSGVMEGHGASIVTLMSASAAIEMGVPIYGIVAMSGTATDKQSESMPAPGKGILTSGREAKSDCLPMRELSVAYRQSQLKRRLGELDTWKAEEYMQVDSKDVAMADCSMTNDRVAWQKRVDARYKRQKKSIQDVWGNEFWKQDHFISPLRGSLAVWGLTADDIGLASFHATATVSNDKNESDVLNAKLKHIGCTPGHVLPIVCQKWLTGHPKAPAAGFMLNGIIQSMRTGLIPGNRNADNIDPDFQQYDYALYLSKTIQTPGIKAALLTSFGFGQVGGELLIVHPDYLFAAVIPKEIDSYNKKLDQRKKNSNRYWQDTLVGNHPFVQVKENPPYTANQEKEVYLNPLAHAKYDAKTKQYKF